MSHIFWRIPGTKGIPCFSILYTDPAINPQFKWEPEKFIGMQITRLNEIQTTSFLGNQPNQPIQPGPNQFQETHEQWFERLTKWGFK